MGRLVVTPKGLFIDDNLYDQLPQGSMSTAKNMVLRRKNVLEPRPGFPSILTSPPTGTVKNIVPYGTDQVLFSLNGSTWSTHWRSSLTQITAPTILTPPDATFHKPRCIEMRKNLYYASDQGMLKLENNSDNDWGTTRQMIGQLYAYVLGGVGTAIPNNTSVSYRAIAHRIDSNVYKVKSYPTAPMRVYNNIGNTADVPLVVGIANLVVGDRVQFYRTRNFTGNVGTDDEMFLLFEQTLTSTDVSNGYVAFTDTLPESNLGEALYTNSTIEGPLQANYLAPFAKDIAEFKGHMFFANLETSDVFQTVLLYTTGNTGLQEVITTGNTSSGSLNVTNIPAAAGAKLTTGMYVSSNQLPGTAASPFQVDTQIASITPGGTYTVVLTKTATANTTGGTVYFHDYISIAGGPFYVSSIYDPGSGLGDGSVNDRVFFPTSMYAFAAVASKALLGVYEVTASQSAGSTAQTVRFRCSQQHPISFVVTSSRPSAFSPYLDNITVSVTATPNGLAWSKFNEPEAVPIVNYTYVGYGRNEIYRIIKSRDVLFILTRNDGVYQLTGDAGEWRIDPLYPTLDLVAPDSIAEYAGAVYGLFRQGVMRISASSIEWIDKPIHSVFQNSIAVIQGRGTMGDPGVTWGAYNSIANEYIIGVADVAGSTTATSDVRVYNVQNDGWTTWDVGAIGSTAGAYDRREGLLYVGTNNGYEVRKERITGTGQFGATDTAAWDNQYNITINTVTTLATERFQVGIAGGSGWTPVVGDVMIKSNVSYRVNEVLSSTSVVVQRGGLTAGGAVAKQSFSCDFTFNPLFEVPSDIQQWRGKIYRFRVFVPQNFKNKFSEPVLVTDPATHQLGWEFDAQDYDALYTETFSIREADAYFRFESITVEYVRGSNVAVKNP